MRIQELSIHQRPREKALALGCERLSDEELLALFIRKGVKEANALEIAHSLLSAHHGFSGIFQSGVVSLTTFLGIGKTKAIELLAIGEIVKRVMKEPLPSLAKPTAFDLWKAYAPSLGNLQKETLILLLYGRRGEYQGERQISLGTEDTLLISHKLILRELLQAGAYSFLVLHNHPSGDPLPSKGEITDTIHLKEEAEELSLFLTDHIIICRNRYFSFFLHGLFAREKPDC